MRDTILHGLAGYAQYGKKKFGKAASFDIRPLVFYVSVQASESYRNAVENVFPAFYVQVTFLDLT